MPRSKWDESYYVKCYELARTGLTETGMAEALGITPVTLADWKTKHPALRDAIERGNHYRKGRTATPTFAEYVYQRLPEELQLLWEQVMALDRLPAGTRKLEALFAEHGKTARQHLFLYALTSCNFNASEALRRVGISSQMLHNWITNDPSFAELWEEINWHKKNFFEGALMDLVAARDTAATIFVNRTQNRDRGYNEKVDVHHSGQVGTGVVDVDSLGLDAETRKRLLAALRAQQAPPTLAIAQGEEGEVIDAEPITHVA